MSNRNFSFEKSAMVRSIYAWEQTIRNKVHKEALGQRFCVIAVQRRRRVH